MDQSAVNVRQSLDDVVVQRLFAAGLDLQAALMLASDHAVADKIDRAISQLDHAIRDLRDTIFDRSPSQTGQLAP
jgi:signal transduction histidine kinase